MKFLKIWVLLASIVLALLFLVRFDYTEVSIPDVSNSKIIVTSKARAQKSANVPNLVDIYIHLAVEFTQEKETRKTSIPARRTQFTLNVDGQKRREIVGMLIKCDEIRNNDCSNSSMFGMSDFDILGVVSLGGVERTAERVEMIIPSSSICDCLDNEADLVITLDLEQKKRPLYSYFFDIILSA